MMILNARQTEESIDPGVIEIVYENKVVYVGSYDDPEYIELSEWVAAGNTIIPYPNKYTTADFIAECRGDN